MVYLRVALVWLLLVPAILRADVKLPAIIGDNMVLQRESDVPMWGWAARGL